MRRVGLSDLDAAARALMAVPPAVRPAFARALIEAAHCADRVRKRTGQPEPSGATGSLFVQAGLHPQRPAAFACSEYVQSMEAVLQALVAWRGRGAA